MQQSNEKILERAKTTNTALYMIWMKKNQPKTRTFDFFLRGEHSINGRVLITNAHRRINEPNTLAKQIVNNAPR